MPVEPISEPPEGRQVSIFAHGQSEDIAHAALVEIAGRSMVNRMRSPPDVVGRQSQHSENPANPVTHIAVPEEGSVTAIMLDREQPDQKGSIHDREAGGKPVAAGKRPAGQDPKDEERDKGDQKLEDAPPVRWLPVNREDPDPITRIPVTRQESRLGGGRRLEGQRNAVSQYGVSQLPAGALERALLCGFLCRLFAS